MVGGVLIMLEGRVDFCYFLIELISVIVIVGRDIKRVIRLMMVLFERVMRGESV